MREWIDLFEHEERIDELTKYKQGDEVAQFIDLMKDSSSQLIHHNSALLREFVVYLRGKGYVPYGSGCFGVTFTHPSLNYVLKMFVADPAYMRFVRFALDNQSNPHLPKFRGKFMKLSENCFVVRMEELAPIVRPIDRKIVELIEEYRRRYAGKQMAFSAMLMTKYSDTPAILAAFDATRFMDVDMMDEDPSEVARNGLLDTVDALIGVKTGAELFDIHDGNFMKRGTTIVFTDPFFDRAAKRWD